MNMKKKFAKLSKVIFIVWFFISLVSPVYAQSVEEIMKQTSGKNNIMNAVLEAIQFAPEQGASPDEQNITCYFMFRKDLSNYYHRVDLEKKEIEFTFNDAVLGEFPIESASEGPIKGFNISTEVVDANKVEGLAPDLHNIIKITFYCVEVPKYTTKEEDNIISFSFRWSANPDKQEDFIQKPKSKGKSIVIWSSVGVAVAGGVTGLVLFLNRDKDPEPESELSWNDLPDHPDGL